MASPDVQERRLLETRLDDEPVKKEFKVLTEDDEELKPVRGCLP